MADWLLWLGGIFSEEVLLKHSATSPATNRWQGGLVKALSEQKRPVILLAHLPEPMWPRGKFRPGKSADFDPHFDSRLVPYWNIPFARSASLCRSYVKCFHDIYRQHGKPLAVLSYNPTPEGVATGLLAQKHYQTPWVDICADHYDPGVDWAQYAPSANLAKGHVFLSYHAFHNCPFPVKMHLDGGIGRLRFTPGRCSVKKTVGKKIVVYTGMMSIWGGISFLLKAFERVRDPDIELWICGHGGNSDLTEALKRDNRIRFFGLVAEARLNEICEQASVLVNPRPSHVPGNTMNFPSKVLEYLSYGKPVISTWTSGLSPEYGEVLEVLNEETEECLAKTIENVLHWPDAKVAQNSIKIAEFLLKNKTWACQANRLINWVKNDLLL